VVTFANIINRIIGQTACDELFSCLELASNVREALFFSLVLQNLVNNSYLYVICKKLSYLVLFWYEIWSNITMYNGSRFNALKMFQRA